MFSYILILTLIFAITQSTKNHEQTLVLASVVFRHGDRTPDAATGFPTNIYANESYYPFGHGELTLIGKKRAYEMGKALNDRFGKFLGNIYYPPMIDASASSYSRTQMSLQSALAGLFSPTKTNQVSNKLPWQPISYKIIPATEDRLIASHKTCPKITLIENYEIADNETLEFYAYLTQMSGLQVKSPVEVMYIQNMLYVHQELGLELPEWVLPIWPEPLTKYAMEFWDYISKNNLQYSAGTLINKIAQDSWQKSQETVNSARKLYLYSGHDLNIVTLLGVLGAYKKEYVNYSAYITFELHKIKNVYGIKIYYQNYETSNPRLLKIPGCAEFCPIVNFIAYAQQFQPYQWCI